MRILDLFFKDILQILRDKRSLLFLVAMPIAFTLFMGFVYRSGENGEPQDMRMSLAWVEDTPGSDLSHMLYVHLEESHLLKPVFLDIDAALESLEQGEVDGVVIIPSEYDGQVRSGEIPQVTLIADPASTRGQSLYQLLRVPVSQLMSAVEIGQESARIVGHSAEFAPALKLAWEKWDVIDTRIMVRVEQAEALVSESWFGDNPYNQASPGILVQFAIMGLVTSAQIVVQERKSRTLKRLMVTAMKPWEIVVGHILAMFVIVFLQIAMLVIFGQLLLDVNYLREPMGTLLVLVALGMWVSSMSLLIGLLAKGDNQVILYSMVAMFIFSGLGGAWFQLEMTGGVIATIGRLLPSAWAMTGLQNILIRGLGLSSIWQPVGILTGYALGFFVLAVWQFRKMEI